MAMESPTNSPSTESIPITLITPSPVSISTSLPLPVNIDFPQNEQEILNVLNNQSALSQIQIFEQKSIGSIVNDDEIIDKLPRARALILFDYNSNSIKSESLPLLREYVKTFREKLAKAVIIIAGHTDNTGSDTYNYELSLRRAEAIRDYLVSEYQIDPALVQNH